MTVGRSADVPAFRASDPPPYRWALVVSAVVLLGLLVSLAPSVTFWDAGEFVSSMKILGIPHPPGTPLFVMMGHVFGKLFPLGEYAFRTNLQSALFASAGAGCWFLVLQEAAGRYLGADEHRGVTGFRLAAGAAGALIAAFGFTNWLNSNETEVYAVSTFTIAAVSWLLLRWRAARGTPHASRHLLLIAFLLGIAIGNHLLGLLVGPAAVVFMVAELRLRPAAEALTTRREWGDAILLAGLWALLTGIGLGNPTLIVLGAVVFVLALLLAWTFAASPRQLGFGLLLLAIALVGVTPYLYLYIRSAQHPMVNEAAPATWQALIDVIRRAQYEVRTPLDDPTFRHDDPNNPGRSLYLIGLQLLNYLQYFDWQWAKSASVELVGRLTLRTLIMLGFLALGTRGFVAQWRSDRSGAWLLLTLFLVTGLGLVAYMNFKPGFSLGYERYPNTDDHEVRERDYFFVVSFVVWGLWCGLGLLTLARRVAERLAARRALAYSVFAAALIPFALNFREADRQHGPDARLAGDFAYDLLNSVPPYGILFTYGDNDTFPLWWAQEVAGVRRDVTVVCLALAETEWYMQQLRDNPVRLFDEAAAPPIWRGLHPVAPTWPLHTMTDQDIEAAIPQLLPNDVTLTIGPYQTTLPARSPVYGKDILALRVIQQNFRRRPIGWGLTAAGTTYGLDRFLLQRGLAVMLEPSPVDTTKADYDLRRLMGAPLDIPVTERLMNETYRYARLLEGPHRDLETTAKGIASTLGLPYTQLAFAMQARNDGARTRRYLDRASLLSANPALARIFDSLGGR
jgi:transmembrane protein TMEM260 (protein O-mannosyltransferase)